MYKFVPRRILFPKQARLCRGFLLFGLKIRLICLCKKNNPFFDIRS